MTFAKDLKSQFGCALTSPYCGFHLKCPQAEVPNEQTQRPDGFVKAKPEQMCKFQVWELSFYFLVLASKIEKSSLGEYFKT